MDAALILLGMRLPTGSRRDRTEFTTACDRLGQIGQAGCVSAPFLVAEEPVARAEAREGMSIHTSNRIFFVTTTVLVFLLAVFALLLFFGQRELKLTTNLRYHSYLLADELRQSSDDLTRMARTYVITGDPKFERMYWEILAIRNGQAPRPHHYERIYWDLVAGVSTPSVRRAGRQDFAARADGAARLHAIRARQAARSRESIRMIWCIGEHRVQRDERASFVTRRASSRSRGHRTRSWPTASCTTRDITRRRPRS